MMKKSFSDQVIQCFLITFSVLIYPACCLVLYLNLSKCQISIIIFFQCKDKRLCVNVVVYSPTWSCDYASQIISRHSRLPGYFHIISRRTKYSQTIIVGMDMVRRKFHHFLIWRSCPKGFKGWENPDLWCACLFARITTNSLGYVFSIKYFYLYLILDIIVGSTATVYMHI